MRWLAAVLVAGLAALAAASALPDAQASPSAAATGMAEDPEAAAAPSRPDESTQDATVVDGGHVGVAAEQAAGVTARVPDLEGSAEHSTAGANQLRVLSDGSVMPPPMGAANYAELKIGSSGQPLAGGLSNCSPA